MTVVAFAWELGANLGHLERDLAIAVRLREHGHDVRFVVANAVTAEKLLSPQGFSYVTCPMVRRSTQRQRHTVNFSDILAEANFDDASALQAVVRAWLELWRLIKPDVIVIDHAPSALLSSHILDLPAVLLGPGFAIPPDQTPFPSMIRNRPTPPSALLEADGNILAAVNEVLATFGKSPLDRLATLFSGRSKQVTSFAELDPYGPRKGVHYVGPMTLGNRFEQVQWPGGEGPRIFAYLQPWVVGIDAILATLRNPKFRTICVIPGAPASLLERNRHSNLILRSSPVDLACLLPSTDVVINYASAGLVANALQAGVPLLLVPFYLEQRMNAECAKRLGAGILLEGRVARENVDHALHELVSTPNYKNAARAFAHKYSNFDSESAAQRVAEEIVAVAKRRAVPDELTSLSQTPS